MNHHYAGTAYSDYTPSHRPPWQICLSVCLRQPSSGCIFRLCIALSIISQQLSEGQCNQPLMHFECVLQARPAQKATEPLRRWRASRCSEEPIAHSMRDLTRGNDCSGNL